MISHPGRQSLICNSYPNLPIFIYNCPSEAAAAWLSIIPDSEVEMPAPAGAEWFQLRNPGLYNDSSVLPFAHAASKMLNSRSKKHEGLPFIS